MKNFILVSVFVLGCVFIACTNEYSKPICVQMAIEREGMQDYRGEKIEGCVDYLIQYQWNQEFYFDWNNPCVDKISMPIDCFGQPLTENYSDSIFSAFHLEAEVIGIVGIRN